MMAPVYHSHHDMMALVYRRLRVGDCIFGAGKIDRCMKVAQTERLELMGTELRAALKVRKYMIDLFGRRFAQVAATFAKNVSF